MKILVLTNDLMERSVIQQVLQHNNHEIITVGNSEGAMQLLREGDIRFVIADRTTTDIDEKEFIKRLRDAKPPYYIYVLLIIAKVQDVDIVNPRSGADDYLRKPVAPVELKSRFQLGERMLGLGDNLLQARETLDNMAIFDPLTNTLNQKAFLNLSHGELERARRQQAPLSLIAIQINNFDEIMNQYGDAIGNDVLVVIAQGIREKSRPYDGTGHYEKSLFLIPLPGVIGQDAEKVAIRILKEISNSNISLLDGTSLDLNLSIAVVSATRITVSTEMKTLIEKAREVLSHIKHDGGNLVDTVFI